jgi:hypothetical protein
VAFVSVVASTRLAALEPKPTERKAEEATAGHDNAKANPKPTAQMLPSVIVTPSPNLQQIPNKNTENSNKEKTNYRLTDILLTIFNGLLAMFTLALVIVGGYQARHLRRTVEATEQTAKAAEASAQVATEGLRIAQRAYVHVHEITDIRVQIGSKPRARVQLKNTGLTPRKICL